MNDLDASTRTPLLPGALSATEQSELDAWCDALLDDARNAIDAEATPEQFRDDGTPYHGQLPSGDLDAFNPHLVARAEIYPAPLSIHPGALLRFRTEAL